MSSLSHTSVGIHELTDQQAATHKYQSSLKAVLHILKTEGLSGEPLITPVVGPMTNESGLYAGLLPKLLQSVMTAAFMFVAQRRIYEMVKGVSQTFGAGHVTLTLTARHYLQLLPSELWPRGHRLGMPQGSGNCAVSKSSDYVCMQCSMLLSIRLSATLGHARQATRRDMPPHTDKHYSQ